MEHEAAPALASDTPPAATGRDAAGERDAVAAPAARGPAPRPDFAMLYDQYLPRVYRYVFHEVRHAQDAEDLTATIFSKALTTYGRYREQGNLTAWLFSIARHTLRDHQRRRQLPVVNIAAVAEVLEDSALLPEAQLLEAEQTRRLRALLDELPQDQREALELRLFAELRTAEIAEVLGRSEGAVRMLVYRAVQQLRQTYNGGEVP